MASNVQEQLEPETAKFVEALEAKGDAPIYTLTPEQARQVLEEAQSLPVDKREVEIEEISIPGLYGDTQLFFFRPPQHEGPLPVIMYFHGAGWIMGSPNTHDRLVRELAVGCESAVVFVHYTRSPEAKYPQPIEECYAAAKYIYENSIKHNLDVSKFVVAGDSVGGNITIGVTMLAKERKGPSIDFQALFYPVTNGELTSESYNKFAEGPWLTKAGMEWFWNAYQPNKDERKKPLASPINADLKQLEGLPSALVITAENDVLRDEGEAYAHKLMQAGVETSAVRILGTMHDFMMLNALAKTEATKTAFAIAIGAIRKALGKTN